MNFQTLIKTLRMESGMTQSDLAQKLNISTSTVAMWETGRRHPSSELYGVLADIFDVDLDYLYLRSDIRKKISKNQLPPFESISIEEKFRIPVLGEVAAGQPIFAEENYIGYEEISDELAATGTFFGLRIKGDSMSPRIAEGDTVIVRQQDDAESGDIVIVLINGDTATCKRLMKYQEGISLISFNPAYAPMTFSNAEIEEKPIKIIGKVVENRQKW